jgi:hypothetical protein
LNNPHRLPDIRRDGLDGGAWLRCWRTVNHNASWEIPSFLLASPYLLIHEHISQREAEAANSRVPIDDGNYIPARFSEFGYIFRKTQAETLAPHCPIDHAIDLEPEFKISYGRIYTLSEMDLQTLQVYIGTNLANGFIPQFSSLVAAPILLTKEKYYSL